MLVISLKIIERYFTNVFQVSRLIDAKSSEKTQEYAIRKFN